MSDFENDLKEMFEGAEFQPSDGLWAGIERGLAPKKKKGIFFMWQTYGIAAGIALALSLGGLWQNGYFERTPPLDTQEELSKASDDPQKDSTQVNRQDKNELFVINDTIKNKSVDNGLNSALARVVMSEVENNSPQPLPMIAQSITQKDQDKYSRKMRNAQMLVSINKAVSKPYSKSSATRIAKWMNSLSIDSGELLDKYDEVYAEETYEGEQFLNGRLGNNNLNIETPTGGITTESAFDSNLSASSIIFNEEETALGALSVGVGFSFEVDERLQLNASLRYSEFRNSSTSNAYSVENGQSLPIYLPAGYDRDNVNFVGPYRLTNALQGISVLPSLSYQILEFGKFDVAFLGGLGLDYFFSYKIQGDLNFLEVRNADLSRSDLIQEFNLSTITGLSLSYRLNEQFGLSGDITYRYFIPTNGTEEDRRTSILGFGLSLNYYIRNKD